MISFRKAWIAGCVFLSCFTSSASAAEYHFKDVAWMPWAAPSVEGLYQAGIINGVSDTEFAPNHSLTRAQFAALLTNTQKGSYQEKSLPFTDVTPGQWYYQSVKKMYSMGMIKGVSDTQFQPDRAISREEAAAILARTFDYPHNDVSLPFKDQGDIDSWALDSVKKGTAKGIFSVFGDQFRPGQAITRAETAVVLHKLLFGEPAPYDAPKGPPPAPAPTPATEVKVEAAVSQPAPLASRGSDLLQQRLTKVVQSVLGVPYQWGGDSLSGMDCSGLTSYVYHQLGVDLPRESQDQFGAGTSVSVSDMQKGDLIFFDTGRGVISHTGIYMGDNKMVHAATKQGQVMITDMDWYLKHYTVVGVKRILQ